FWGGVILGAIIVISVLNEFAWFGSPWWQTNWVSIVWIVVLVAILAPLFISPKEAHVIAEEKERTQSMPMFKPIR
ncbi:MAG: hypothetical protein AABY16_01415, partial [Nanoarchaeota archaeon]